MSFSYPLKRLFFLIERLINLFTVFFYKIFGSNVHWKSKISLRSKIIVGKGSLSIGKKSVISSFVYIDTEGGKIDIGDYCSINSFCNFTGMGGIKIGNGARIASHVRLISSSHIYSDRGRPIYKQGMTSKGVSVGSNVWLGSGVCVLDGVTICDDVVVSRIRL